MLKEKSTKSPDRGLGKLELCTEVRSSHLQLVTRGKDITYFEIKIALTAKGCIREALGQLLEYNVYPGEQRASEMVVVGEHPATANDGIYLIFV